MSQKNKTKFIFVTGGVVSSIGKGLTAASLASLLEGQGYKVNLMKCDPYINVDPGTMSPLQHGEVYVTKDGAETDLDLGHYERFTSLELQRNNSITAGQIYESVIAQERRGDYLGGTVQVIPHITDEIKKRMMGISDGYDFAIIEIGGTIGDIESLPFIEAIRQMRTDLGHFQCLFMHVTYIPYIAAAGELKSKPTQHSVKELREVGIQPDILICRSEKPMDDDIRKKISLFCNVKKENVIPAMDSKSIYDVPVALHNEKLDHQVCEFFGLESRKVQNLESWKELCEIIHKPEKTVKIGLVGKYVDLKESYKSLHEALIHAGVAHKTSVEVTYVDSEKVSQGDFSLLKNLDGILVPGAFGSRGAEGKIATIQYARENKIPFFGICFGMQMAAVEYARNVCGIKDATSFELSSQGSQVIHLMETQKDESNKGGTMRLGAYPCDLVEGSFAKSVYGEDQVLERHRHRYEFNNKFKNKMEAKGLVFSGVFKKENLVEVLEISDHPWFIGVQYHPEFLSKPLSPHPLFKSFVGASLEQHHEK